MKQMKTSRPHAFRRVTSRTDVSTPLLGISLCFDLDGTLVDTAPDLVRVTNEVIATRGHGPTSFKLARDRVGYGSKRMLQDALAAADDEVSDADLDKLRDVFLSIYADSLDQLSTPFPGVVETLETLAALGARLAVCTNKPGWLARPLLDSLDLTRHFACIVGGDEAPAAKPDPRHVYMAAGHRDPARIAMIGDSWPDVRAGQNAGAFTALVTFGYTPVNHKRLRADTRVSRFRDLVPTLVAQFR